MRWTMKRVYIFIFTVLNISVTILMVKYKKIKSTKRIMNKTVLKVRLRSTPVLAGISILTIISVFVIVPIVKADSYQSQINTLSAQNSSINGSIATLQGQAASYQQSINNLNAQISAIQAALNSNLAKQASLKSQIAANQAELVVQKSILGNDIKTMYVSGQLNTVEMLATSSNISQYVDQQVAYESVQNKIQSTLNQINSLQTSLEQQKSQVDTLVQTESTQNQTLSSDQAQVQSLLNMNQQQQSQYNAQLAANNSKIASLVAAQQAANASVARSVRLSNIPPSDGKGGACDIGQGNGGYPSILCNSPQDSVTDSAGFPNRECTSFANWYFTNIEHQTGFSITGNAGWWFLTTNSNTYPAVTWGAGVKVGALGIEPSSSLNAPVPSLHGGYYGHVMIVIGLPGTTYDGSLPYTQAAAGTYVPNGYVLVMSMNEDEAGHFMYNLWPINYLMYINPN